ncbi:MAG: hypothetical protein L6Q95_14340, partial [Planctomycetes bacterium]|nr:hypothetical protein [Planctomycetota bacterium]
MQRTTLGLLFVLILGAGSAAAPITLGPRYKDESNGFQIQVPEKWDQVPTKFQEVALVGKWSGKAKRGGVTPALLVLRFLQPKEGTAETPREAAEQGVPGYESMMRFQQKNVWEYAENLMWGEHEITEDDPSFKIGAKGLQAHVRIYRQKPGRGDPSDRRMQEVLFLLVVAEVRTIEPSDSVYGVIYGCAVADEENMMSTFKNSIRRFKILEPDEEDVDEEGGAASDANIFVDSEAKPEEWRAARKKKLEGLKDWDALDTKNYLIVYNKEVKRPLLKKIAVHIEQIRADVYEKLFPPSKEVKAISVVRVCKDPEEYHRYGGPGGSAGYWSRGDEELVFYQDKSNKKDSLRVLYHEAFHQYIHYAVGDVAPHSWFNEGHGDYFAGHDCVGGKFIAKPFRWRTGIIANALAQKSYVPLERFLKYTQGEYYANPGLCYAQGWSFIYFLREVERKKIVKYKKYWGLLDRYFEAIKKNVKTVKEGGLEGLNEPPPPPEGDPTAPAPGEGDPVPGTPGEEGPVVKHRDLPSPPPGLEQPFPGENP